MSEACSICAAPLAPDQRYCLDCGTSVLGPRVDWRALLDTPRPAPEREATTARTNRGPLALPTPRVAAALLLVVLGFGVVVGGATGPSVSPSLAAARPDLTVVVPSAPPRLRSAPAPHPGINARSAAPAPSPAFPPVAPEPEPAPAVRAPPTRADDPVIARRPAAPTVPPVKHVFLVSLGPASFDALFGPASQAPYLARELTSKGTLLSRYRAVTKGELANEIALLSGQVPNPQTEANCPVYTAVTPGEVGDDGQANGEGCVYPQQVFTLPDQLTAQGTTWKAYVEDQDAAGAPPPGTCRHPADGQPDPWQAPRPGDAYLTWRNPFVYFQTITTTPDCTKDVVGLTPLAADFARASTTPALAWIVPNACHDGRPTPCADGAPAGPAAADAWLRSMVPLLLSSPAYAAGGLIVIVPDASGGEDPRTGALLLSRYVGAGGDVTTPYDHLSLLKSIEDLFSLRVLGAAQDPDVRAFGAKVYTRFHPSR